MKKIIFSVILIFTLLYFIYGSLFISTTLEGLYINNNQLRPDPFIEKQKISIWNNSEIKNITNDKKNNIELELNKLKNHMKDQIITHHVENNIHTLYLKQNSKNKQL